MAIKLKKTFDFFVSFKKCLIDSKRLIHELFKLKRKTFRKLKSVKDMKIKIFINSFSYLFGLITNYEIICI